MEILYQLIFCDDLVPIQYISVSWALAGHEVYTYVIFKTSLRFPKSLKLMMSKKPMKKGLLLI